MKRRHKQQQQQQQIAAIRGELAHVLAALPPVQRGRGQHNTRIRTAVRDRWRQALELVDAGCTYGQIAKQLGYSSPRSVGRIVRKAQRDRTIRELRVVRSPSDQRADIALLLHDRLALSCRQIAEILGYSGRASVSRVLRRHRARGVADHTGTGTGTDTDTDTAA